MGDYFGTNLEDKLGQAIDPFVQILKTVPLGPVGGRLGHETVQGFPALGVKLKPGIGRSEMLIKNVGAVVITDLINETEYLGVVKCHRSSDSYTTSFTPRFQRKSEKTPP
jgi:hypothetical protein